MELQRFPSEVGDLERKASGTKYSKVDALEAYRLWKDTKREVYKQEAWRRSLPVINIVIMKEFPTIRIEDKSSFISLAATKLWRVLGEGIAPVTNQYHKYIWVCIRRALLDEIRSVIRQRDLPEGALPPPISRVRSINDVDIRMFLQELPEAIRNRVSAELRFHGPERTACLYILDRYLAGVSPAVEILRDDYKVTDASWLCEYVLVRMRIAMYDLRGIKYEGPRYQDELWDEGNRSE